MFSRHLMWEPTPLGGVHPGEQMLPGPQPYNEHSRLHCLTIDTRAVRANEQLLQSSISR
jgi:hypothetical protein